MCTVVYNSTNTVWSTIKKNASDPKVWKDLGNHFLNGNDDPNIIKSEMPFWATVFSPGSAIKGLQIGLRNPQLVKALIEAMKNGTYEYTAARGIISGFVDAKGVYYISEGHHRVAAAMEILKTTGDSGPLVQLMNNGVWRSVTTTPAAARPLPGLDWWSKFRNWIGY